MGRNLFLLAAVAVMASAAQADPIKRATQPSLSPDGSRLVFSYQNDIWIVNAAGGEARRLTVHPAADSTPRWFPDGQRIAFTSNRFGSGDIFTIRADGTDLKRLNHDPSNETLYSISPDGKLLFGYNNAGGRINLFCLSADGGDVAPMTNHPFELSYFPSASPDGRRVAYNLSGAPGNWRNPKEAGTDTGEIWVANLGMPLTTHVQLTKNEHMDTFPLFAPDGTIVFTSNRSGSPQLWRMAADGRNPRQLTRHDGGTLRWSSMSASGQVAYEYDSEIWVMQPNGETRRVSITVPDDQVFNPNLNVSLTSGANRFAVSPDGKRGVIAARGDLFLIPARGGTTRRLTNSLAWDSDPIWLGNDRILFVTGRNAKRELMTMDLNGKVSPFASDALDLTNPVLSPDGKTLAMHRGDREIVVMPVAGGVAPRKVAEGSFPGTYAGGPAFNWSPDNAWIVFENSVERGSTVDVAKVDGTARMTVARVARGAGRPFFSPNGKMIAFDAAESTDGGIQVVDLVSQDLTFTEDDLDKIDEAKPKEAGTVSVTIDPYLIERRKRNLIEDATIVGISPDSRAVWASQGGALVSIPITGGAATPVPGITGFITSVQVDGTARAHFTASGRAFTLNLANGAAAPVNFNAQYQVDRKAEEQALFTEIWWAMDRMYYDPKLHGLNWQAIKQEYGALVPYTFDRADFYALMTEMIEELDSSHLSISTPPGDVRTESEQVGWAGIEWDWAKMALQNQFVVDAVVRGGPADHPNSRLQKGDRVTAVDGRALGKDFTFNQAMKFKMDRKTELTVVRSGQTMTVTLRPSGIGIATGLYYEQFIEDRREEVEKLSGGRYTYFHISGMNGPATDRFFREVRTLGEGKRGAVIDVRWNGGGNTANRILAAIRNDKWLERRFRSMPSTTISEELFRGEALEMPTVIMTNAYSASNAEIFSEGYRRMRLGRVVGEATGGNVLTVAGNYGLWDGGGVQIPFIGIFTVDGESLEGIGRRVDVDIRYNPNDWVAGRDNMLDRAVEELSKRR